jgi:YD repeat-containing protein
VDNTQPFVVDKIYDYHDKQVAEFFYNSNNQLVKALWDTHCDVVEYEQGRVKNIITSDLVNDYVGDFSINLYYDERGQIVKVGYNGAEPAKNYAYLPNGKLNLGEDVIYDKNSNIVKLTQILKNPEPGGWMGPDEFEWIGKYEYDNKSKPDFGIGNVFVYAPLNCYNDDIRVINNLSKNNITKFSINDKTVSTYTYEYNEYGLPISIETKWEGIETIDPMILKIKYKAKEFVAKTD